MLDTTTPTDETAAGKALLAMRQGILRDRLVAGVSRDPDLTNSQEAILLYLAFGDGARECRVMHVALGVNKPRIIRAINGLEQYGLATRKYHPDDRRVAVYGLTPAGVHLARRLARKMRDALQAVAA